MRALQLVDGPGLDHLKFVDLPDPTPGPHEVLVRMRTASLNYRDLATVSYGGAPLPLIPLSDGAGVVEQVGAGVTRFVVGDRVTPLFFQKWLAGPVTVENRNSALGGSLPGVARELGVFHEDGVSKFPDFLTDEEAATLPCAGLTAWRAMFEDARLQPGDTVLMQGTGGVSIFGLQFAKAAGYRTIITSSSDAKLQRATAMGADHVINYKTTPDWGRAARDITGGHGVDFVMEVGGAGTLSESVRAIALMGHVAIIGVLGGMAEPLQIGMMIGTGARLQGVMVGSRAMYEAMGRAMTLHTVKPVVDKVYPFAEAVDAFEAMRAGSHFGKIVLKF